MQKRPMLRLVSGPRQALGAVAALLVLGLAAPAAAETVYSWRTEDGGYAFTDDPKAIPERYRDDAEARPVGNLSDYERFTPEDPQASDHYAERLAARLEHLRRVNAPAPRSQAGAAKRRTQMISLRTGGGTSPALDITADESSDDPIIVETFAGRPRGKIVTRDNVVVRQGDRVLSIVRPRTREWNIADDIHDEDDLY